MSPNFSFHNLENGCNENVSRGGHWKVLTVPGAWEVLDEQGLQKCWASRRLSQGPPSTAAHIPLSEAG